MDVMTAENSARQLLDESEEIFASVATHARPEESTGLDPRATRYGFTPIWPIKSLEYTTCYVPEVPANVFFPYRIFQIIVPTADGDRRVNVMPENQIRDMQTRAGDRGFIELHEVALLEDEGAARRIFEILTPQSRCEKYPRLGRKCITCWQAYLESPEFEFRLSELMGELYDAAEQSANRMLRGFSEALARAQQNYEEAIEMLESTSSGKSSFNDWDRLNTHHSHLEVPLYRKTQPAVPQNLGREIAQGLKDAFGGGVPAAGSGMEDELKAKIAELEAQIASAEQSEIVAEDENLGQKMARLAKQTSAKKAEKAKEKKNEGSGNTESEAGSGEE